MTGSRWLALALVSSLAACASPPAPARTVAAPTPAAAQAPLRDLEEITFGDADAFMPRVHLLDAGDGERSPLRWQPGPPHALKVSIATHTSGKGTDDDSWFDERARVEVVVDVEARTLAPGQIHILAMIREAKLVDGKPDGDGIARYTALVGHGVVWNVSDRGQLFGHGTAIAEGGEALGPLLDEVARALAPAITVPVPREAVGVGARWRVREPVVVRGMYLLQETVYTLARREPLDHGHTLSTFDAHVARTPLIDAGGFIEPGDHPRVTAAIEASASASFDQLARRSDTNSRGRYSAVLADVAPMIGKAQWSVATPFQGHFESETRGEIAIRGELRDEIAIELVPQPATAPRPAASP